MNVAIPGNDLTEVIKSDGIRRSASPRALVSGSARSELARTRLPLARAALANCHLCAHHCGVNRLSGERALCKAGSVARVFSAQVEVADELELIPTFAIALSGCDLRCDFCVTGAQSWNPRAGGLVAPGEIARRAEAALTDGARTVMILGGEPTIHLPSVLEIIAALPDEATLVWKTNAHASVEALELLDGLVDVWLPDYKFGNDDCARRLARVSDYTSIVRANLRWMRGATARCAHDLRVAGVAADGADLEAPMQPRRLCYVGRTPFSPRLEQPATADRAGFGQRPATMIVRHLLMPGHVECCWRPIAEWLAEEMPEVKVSLKEGFWPGWRSGVHVKLRLPLTRIGIEDAFSVARKLGITVVE